MICSDNSINILTIQTYKGIGKAWIVKNISGDETIDKIVSLLNMATKEESVVSVEEFCKKRDLIKNKLLKIENYIDGIISIGDKDFPKHRGIVNNSEQPVIIFYKGNIKLLDINNHNIAVIGVLEPDNSAIIREEKIVQKLVSNNVTIVSGLAVGCDAIAHEQTLKSGGKTIAILPGPLNNIIPFKNADLANQIIRNNGLLITEYYEETKSQQELFGRYQERDRLQALFSDYIILVSSYAKNDIGNDSGSRLAMGYALKYGIKRAVLYNIEIDSKNPKFDLNRQIIQEDNSITIINHSDMADEIVNSRNDNCKIDQISMF